MPSISDINVDQLKENQLIALFAKFNNVKDFFFWSCKVVRTTTTTSDKNTDALLNCAPAIDIDDEDIEDAKNKQLPLPTQVWLKQGNIQQRQEQQEQNNKSSSLLFPSYEVKPATKKDAETKFENLIDGHMRRIWFNPQMPLTVPPNLFKDGFHLEEQQASSTPTENNNNKIIASSFQMFDRIIGDLHMDCHYDSFRAEVEEQKMSGKKLHHQNHHDHNHQHHQQHQQQDAMMQPQH